MLFNAGSGTFTNSAAITGGTGGAGGTAWHRRQWRRRRSGRAVQRRQRHLQQFGRDHRGQRRRRRAARRRHGGNGGDGAAGRAVQCRRHLDQFRHVTGGAGGAGGSGGTIAGVSGAGGAGISGAGLTIIDSGTIIGGLSGDGLTRAAPITFTGGTNTLELQAGFNIIGNVVAFSPADTFRLGGSANASFDVSLIGTQYQNFGIIQKTGSSTWTLINATTVATPWFVNGGLLNFNSASNFGTGLITLDGGGLQWASGTSTDISSRLAPFGVGGATFDTNGNNVTLASVLSGAAR